MSHPPTEREHIELLLRTAQLYYEQDLGQGDVARAIGYSRPTVSRLLAEARKRGIVQISVHHPLQRLVDAEQRLRSRYGLAIIGVADVEEPSRTAPAASLAASILARLGHDRVVVALSNGTSVAAVVGEMPQQRWGMSTVVQMIGSLGRSDEERTDSPELSRQLATRLGGVFRTMPVPIVVAKASTADAIRHEPMVVANLELAARADIAVTGVGALTEDSTSTSSMLGPYLTPQAREDLRRRGAVGHICGHFIDASGRHIHDELCPRVIAMAPERLTDIRSSILVAWGAQKIPAIRAALASGWISGLVTDAPTAYALLDDVR